MRNTIYATAAALALASIPSVSIAVEGGASAYLLGSRAAFAGIVPGPGFYLGMDFVYLNDHNPPKWVTFACRFTI